MIEKTPSKRGLPWTPGEEETLKANFAETASIAETAARHQRTSGGIQSRLVKLGVLTPEGEPVTEPRTPSPERAKSAGWLARFHLSPRLSAALAALDVQTIESVMLVTSDRLLEVPGMRRRTIRELPLLQERLQTAGDMAAIKPTTDALRDVLDRANASVRLRRALQSCGITTMEALLRCRPEQILVVHTVGRETVAELRKLVQELAASSAARGDTEASDIAPKAEASPDGQTDMPKAKAIARLDQLMDTLQSLRKTLMDSGNIIRASKEVIATFARFDNAMYQLVIGQPDQEAETEGDGEPLPDRLRAALVELIATSVPDLKNRYVAIQVLGLGEDGQAARLSDLAPGLKVGREAVRLRKKMAFPQIRGAARRRTATCQRLHAVLQMIAPETNWTDPRETARHVVHWLSDKEPVVTELTSICCLAAGWPGNTPTLTEAAKQAAADECKKTLSDIQWRLDIWKEATRRALFPADPIFFDDVPADLEGRKREPGETRDEGAIFFRSNKLGRDVACESATEYKVMAWLERTDDVVCIRNSHWSSPMSSTARTVNIILTSPFSTATVAVISSR